MTTAFSNGYTFTKGKLPNFLNYDASGVLHAYSTWLGNGYSSRSGYSDMRGGGAALADEACLNHLFVHSPNLGGTLGVAWLGVLCSFEPDFMRDYNGRQQFCSNSADPNCNYYAMNAGFTTSNSRGTTLEHLTELIVTTHELGYECPVSALVLVNSGILLGLSLRSSAR